MSGRTFDAASVARLLDAHGVALGRPLAAMISTGSTNDDAKRAGQAGAPHGAAFVADAQRAGRGRLGRTWHSPAGENLYASFLLRPKLDGKAAPLLTIAAGLAVREALASFVPAGVATIKWPNDVYLNGRKVAGILAEGQVAGQLGGASSFVVLGAGVNVHTTAFPPEIEGKATSLALEGAPDALEREAVFVAIAVALERRLAQLESGAVVSIVSDLAEHDALRGRTITVDGEPATALGVALDGALRIRRSDGSEGVVVAGDVQPTRGRG